MERIIGKILSIIGSGLDCLPTRKRTHNAYIVQNGLLYFWDLCFICLLINNIFSSVNLVVSVTYVHTVITGS